MSLKNMRRPPVALVAGLIVFLSLAVRPALAEDAKVLPLKVHVGEKAPNFSLLAANGKTIWLSDYTGHNVLIDFYRGYW